MKYRIFTSLSLVLFFALALLFVLVACSGSPGGNVSPIQPPENTGTASSPGGAVLPDTSTGPDAGGPAPEAPPVVSPAQPEDSGQPTPPENTPVGQPAAPESSPADQPAAPKAMTMREAYRFALEGIYRDHLYPNGDAVDVPGDAHMEDNDFAVFDVDGDGTDELIFQNDNSSMAGMVTAVFGFDPDTGTLYQELSGFVGMTFYSNGVVQIDASHNQGMGQMEGFWPFALYQYDPGSDGYLMCAYVDGWDGTFFPEDYDGNPFPGDLDQDGDKAVYILTWPGEEVTETIVDGPAYREWLDSYLGGAAPLTLPWQTMTVEHIQAVSP